MRQANLEDLQNEAWLRSREKGNIVWVTREGKKIPIKDMTDEHLLNTIKMLKRQAEEEAMYEEALSSFPSKYWF